MVGNFSFGRNDYFESIDLWDSIVKDLKLSISYVTYHPTQIEHQQYWSKKGYTTKPDEDCVWSDGTIGGYCCELFIGHLEIGNLVNTLGHSTDVGFGLERLLQCLEQKSRVDETGLFDQSLSSITRDHVRTLKSLKQNGIVPGYKNRGSVCRRLLQRILKIEEDLSIPEIQDWIDQEKQLQNKRLATGKRVWFKHKKKSPEWWLSTFGITLEDLELLKKLKGV
jgi:alanyl-tRNA synthetase